LVVIVALLLLAGLSTGGIGDGRLVHLGPQMSTLVLPLIGVVVLTTAVVLGVLATPLIPWTRDAFRSMRERVEAAERTERSGDTGGGADAGGGEDTATADGAVAAEAAGRSAVEDVPEPVIPASADLEADAWSLDTEDASDPAQPGSGISRRTDR